MNKKHENEDNKSGVRLMAKQGMRRPDPKEPHGTESNKKLHIPKNDVPPVPEIQGKAKSGKKKANPIKDSEKQGQRK